MTESDDGLFGGGDVDVPSKKAENVKRTAETLPQDTEDARRNKRISASALTQSFAKPVLGVPGLKGLNKTNVLGLSI